MATAALTNTPTVIDNAEATTNWNGDTFSLEPDIKVQGNNSIACAQTSTGNNEVFVDGLSFDASAVHLRLWFNISYIGNLSGTNPCQLFISDGTNTAYYDYDISTYAGGWRQAVVYTGNTPLSGTKPTGNTTEVGIRFVTASKPRNVPANAWYDAWTYGDGYTVTGGTSGDEIDWSHIASVDSTNAFGIVEEINSVFFLAGEITIGDGISTTYFKPVNKIAVFKDLDVLSTLYQLIFFDDASALTNIEIATGAWSAAGVKRFKLDASVADVNSFSINGLQMSRIEDGSSFHAGASITNSVFNDCLQVDPKTSTFTDNTFSNSTATDGALLWPTSGNASDLVFINCDNGVEIPQAVDQTFANMVFDDVSGNYDVNVTGGSAITISNTLGTNANSYNPGGSVATFQDSNSLTVIVKSEDTGGLLSDARVYIEAGATGPLTEGDVILAPELTGADGTVVATINGSGQSFIGLVTEALSPGLYVPKPIAGTIPSGGATINVGLVLDE